MKKKPHRINRAKNRPGATAGRIMEWGHSGNLTPEMLADAKARFGIPDDLPPTDLEAEAKAAR